MQPFVLLCFLLSGISGLTLEIVWTRMLEHVFGATTLAISTVLTCFMGGLALGSWLFGRFSDRLRRPLLVYAIAEGIIGVIALVIPILIEGVYPSLNRWMVANYANNFWLLSLLRFAAVAAVLLIPTTCMGATLPLLSRHFVTHEAHMHRVGSRVGALYTVNTIGAIGGVFLSTFALLPGIGLAATNRTAGLINIFLCIAIFACRKWLFLLPTRQKDSQNTETLDTLLAQDEKPSVIATPLMRHLTLVAFFLSGLAAMNLQVVWNRAMAMIIGASVYSFSLVLIAFLIGLAGGAAVFSKLVRRIRNPVFALALVELGIAGCAMLNFIYMDDLPRVFAHLVTTHISSYDQHVGLVQFLMFAVAAFAVLPATFFMGATFPLTIRIASADFTRVGRDVGSVYALNTFGAICGSFLSAFVFVPLFSRYFGGAGMQSTFFLSVGIYAITGLALALVATAEYRHRLAVAIPAMLLVLAFLFRVPGWDPAALTIGIFRISLMKDALDEESWGDPDIKYYYDGVSTTVSIELWGRHFALKNNGKVDASNGDDMPTQIMVAAYPLLFHPQGPKDLEVAIVGFGSGVTVGSALAFPIAYVDAIELENAVVEASRVFGTMEGEKTDPDLNVNHLTYRQPFDPITKVPNPDFDWSDPNTYVIDDRLTLFNNDGRNFLASSPKQYDVIISEPSNPWITGVSNMFTVDNFLATRQALKPDGIFCQWVQLYELSPENIKTIFRTFASVFPHVALFAAEDLSSDTVLLGSFKPLTFDLERVQMAMALPSVRDEMKRAYIFSATDVFARVLLVNQEELNDYTNSPGNGSGSDSDLYKDLPINTDDNAIIEFAAPRDLISFSRFAGYLATIYTDEWSYGRLIQVVEGFGTGVSRARNLAEQAVSLLANGRKRQAAAFLKEAAQLASDEPSVQLTARMANLLEGKEGAPLPLFDPPSPSLSMTEDQIADLRDKVADVLKSVNARAYRDALERFQRIPEHLWRPGGAQMLLLKGYLHYLNADPEDTDECKDAIHVLSQIVREYEAFASDHPEIYFYLALCHDNALHFDKAVKNIRTYVTAMDKQEAHAKLTLAQAEANFEAAIKGLKGTVAIDLPPDPKQAPTTDGQGESPKELYE
ncbi:MAG: spermidine synthase [Myxococcota bacterium]|nr:spermidine synthase [Myxococcota bacterium]